MGIPDLFIERLRQIVPPNALDGVIQGFSCGKLTGVRINKLKGDSGKVLQQLQESGHALKQTSWLPADGFLLEGSGELSISKHPAVEEGDVYIQSGSSMVPVRLLGPRPGENILDLCAAPGSKATQIASAMENMGSLICVEPIRGRFYKLKSILKRYGVSIAETKCLDGRKFRWPALFDRILVDAPCSSEGRFRSDDPKTFQYWSPRKIKEMVRKQRGLLLNASRLLKPGGVLVYSTCTFAPEENEGVIDWVLRKSDEQLEVESIRIEGLPTYPSLSSWKNKEFSPEVQKTLRVLPTEMTDGFFIAKLKKKGL